MDSLTLMPLSLPEMGKLWKLLYPYLPDNMEELSVMDFVSQMIEQMKEDEVTNYGECLEIITRMKLDELVDRFTVNEILGLFVDGLSLNKILLFKQFALGEI